MNDEPWSIYDERKKQKQRIDKSFSLLHWSNWSSFGDSKKFWFAPLEQLEQKSR